jgi:hypothetical protein
LGLTDFRREFPAWRGEGRPGFLDFLGIDRSNRLHVIETKVNPDDVAVVLQTLDYAIWVAANAKEIRERNDWHQVEGRELDVVCDFIFAPRVKPAADAKLQPVGYAIGSYIAGQLETLSSSIPWTVSLVADPAAEVPHVEGFRPHRMPPVGPLMAEPVQGPRWAARLQADLLAES